MPRGTASSASAFTNAHLRGLGHRVVDEPGDGVERLDGCRVTMMLAPGSRSGYAARAENSRPTRFVSNTRRIRSVSRLSKPSMSCWYAGVEHERVESAELAPVCGRRCRWRQASSRRSPAKLTPVRPASTNQGQSVPPRRPAPPACARSRQSAALARVRRSRRLARCRESPPVMSAQVAPPAGRVADIAHPRRDRGRDVSAP